MPILCGTDFSRQSAWAVRIAADFAKRLRETVVLVHVVEPRTRRTIRMRQRAWFEKSVHDTVEDALDRRARWLRRQGVDATIRVLEGRPDQRLLAFAEKIEAPL